MTDDDLRAMLRSKAQDATTSPDAWEKITARIAEPERRPARNLLRVAGGAVAAAAVAGAVLVSQNNPTSQVATDPTTTTEQVTTPVGAGDPVTAATAWLQARVPQANLVPGELQSNDGDGNAVVVFRGAYDTEVHLRLGSGIDAWFVVNAVSDMILLSDVTFDGNELVGRATPEADGVATITYVLDGEEQPGGVRDATRREDVMLGLTPTERVTTAAVRVTLVVGDTTYLSEVTAERIVDPAAPTGSYVAVWPATDAPGLASLQEQADDGFRPDLLDPQAVAGGFLSELLPRGETPTSFQYGEFQQGDNSSGEVPYTLSDGASGTILLRRMGEGSIWYVTGATSDDLEVVEARHEGRTLVADVRTGRAGTLTWTGATPIPVEAGQTVSIGRPDTEEVGSYPIVVRLMDGDRTLAIAARLG